MAPWTEKELEEIAQLRNAGHGDSYIRGQMKVARGTNVVPHLTDRSEPMATKRKTKKKASKKKVSKKKTSKKVTKKASRKKGGKPGRKKGDFLLGDKVTAVKGLDDYFYKKFPRYKAYELICKKGSMPTDAFVDAIEKIDGVKSRAQALGILTKLVEKECVKVSGARKAA